MKLSKPSVQYEHPAKGPNHCGICGHFLSPYECEIVTGKIRSEDWCNRFERADKLRVLVIDQELQALDFVLRASACGHEVRWYRHAEKPTKIGEGFSLVLVDDWRQSMPWVGRDGLVWLTGNFRFLTELDRWREMGWRIFGPTVASARLEIDRTSGMEAMQAAGIEVPHYEVFDSLRAARAYAAKADRPMVHKPMGDEPDKSLTYVPHEIADLIGWLDRQIAAGKKPKGPVMLQEKVDLLCELGVSGWVGPDGFLPDLWQVCVEHKKMMDGEIGPSTGEMGTLCQYVVEDRLADEMLKPMDPILRALGHRGDFAIGCGIDKRGKAWPFEFTARSGWPAWHIQMACHRGDPVRWMSDLLDGKASLKVSYDVAIGVVMGQRYFPHGNSPAALVEGIPIGGLDEAGDAVHLVSAMRAGDEVQTAGEYVLVATGLGKTIERARAKAYGAVHKIRYPDPIYRSDIGCKVIDCLPKLRQFGYLTDVRA